VTHCDPSTRGSVVACRTRPQRFGGPIDAKNSFLIKPREARWWRAARTMVLANGVDLAAPGQSRLPLPARAIIRSHGGSPRCPGARDLPSRRTAERGGTDLEAHLLQLTGGAGDGHGS